MFAINWQGKKGDLKWMDVYQRHRSIPSKPILELMRINLEDMSLFTRSIGSSVAVGALAYQLQIPVLVRSLKSSYVELDHFFDGKLLFECCLSAATNS